MKILGIDTSTKFMCLGVYDGHKMYEYKLEVARKLSSLLSVTIKRILEVLNLGPDDIDYFACGLGPGSFTGTRTGLSTIKGMSWALKKPLIGISTLDILARNVKDYHKPIVPIIDAKRDLIYCSLFKNKPRPSLKSNIALNDGRGKNVHLVKIKPDMLLSKEELFKKIKGNAIILGDAIDLYREKILMHVKGATILDKDYWYPKAHNIIALALERIRDRKFDDPFTLKPIYLYPKECQIRQS